jgi:hypothetical protein
MPFTREQIEAMNETELREEILKPLLEAMDFQGVYIAHGSSELGKDIVCWKSDPWAGRLNHAVVAKAEDIRGTTTGTNSAAAVLTQVEQCFNEPYVDPQTAQEQKVDQCWVITSRRIIPTALPSIRGKLEKSNLDKLVLWIDGDKLWDLVDQHLNPGPAGERIFEPIPLPQTLDLSELQHSELPSGWILLGGIPFEITPGPQGFPLVALIEPTLANEPVGLTISQEAERACQIHLLITASYAIKLILGYGPGEGWDGKVCGKILVDFEDGTSQEQKLTLGYHLRDWDFGNQPWAVDALRSEQAQQVWHSSDNQCTLDLLSVLVKDGPKTVTSARLVAQMERGLAPATLRTREKVIAQGYPRIRLHALTFETDASE